MPGTASAASSAAAARAINSGGVRLGRVDESSVGIGGAGLSSARPPNGSSGTTRAIATARSASAANPAGSTAVAPRRSPSACRRTRAGRDRGPRSVRDARSRRAGAAREARCPSTQHRIRARRRRPRGRAAIEIAKQVEIVAHAASRSGWRPVPGTWSAGPMAASVGVGAEECGRRRGGRRRWSPR